MANVRLWRQISLWLWLSCLLLAVYSAPVNEEESVATTLNDNQNKDDLGAAIDAVRAKRDTRKKSSKGGRNLVRYRYPIQMKRSAGIGQSDEDYELLDGESGADEEERDDTLAALLGGEELVARTDNDIDLDELAKEIALDILMEEADKGRTSQHRSTGSAGLLMKKKKAAPTAHRPRYLSLDDKRRKRMNSLVNQLLSQDYDDNHEDDEQHSSAAGPLDNDDNWLDEDEEEDQDQDASRTMLRELASQGLDRHEIDALLSQLERSRDELKPENKKRSSEWRKLPRASLRWRFLHSMGDNNEPTYGRHQSEEQELEPTGPLELNRQDKSIPFENRYFGRGFHRVGPHIQDGDIGRSSDPAAAKRVQHPLKTKNAVSLINKRSISTSSQNNHNKEQSSRKRRSPSATTGLKANETTPPLALPVVVETKNENSSEPGKESAIRKVGAHSGVIRKKSVDWDDYFGYDKRSKSDNSEDEAMKEFLESEYYKSLGGSVGFRKRAGEDHSSHGGMKKRTNGTVSMLKKRNRGANLEDAEEALDAAFRVVQERRERDNLERVREQLVAELIENLDEDELDQMTEQLSEELAEAIRQDEEEGIFEDEDESMAVKRSNKLKHKKKKSLTQNDERRKRFAIKRTQKGRHRADTTEDGEDCVVAEQVVVTCNMVSHLYGGYRPVLSDACFRHQACFICSDNEAACDAEFQHRVLALCGSDLLCQSQSRHLLSALGQLDQMEADYLDPLGGRARIETLCRRDSCLAEFWKRR